jgi:hypothetical protein
MPEELMLLMHVSLINYMALRIYEEEDFLSSYTQISMVSLI